MYKKEENFKEKFRQALISTAKVISDDYKSLKNKPGIQIRSVDLSQELQILSYYLDRKPLKVSE